MTAFPHCRCKDYAYASLPYRVTGPVVSLDTIGNAQFCFTIIEAPIGPNGDVCTNTAPANCCQTLKAELGKVMFGVSK